MKQQGPVVYRRRPCRLPALITLLCACTVVAACGGASKRIKTTVDATAPPAAPAPAALPPAAPTGSGSALDESYAQRCRRSLAHPPPFRVRGAGSVTETTLRSPDTSQTPRQVWVYRPGGISDDARLPVVYLLHGHPGSGAGIWKKTHAARGFDALFRSGARPFVVVTMDGEGARHKDSEWADSVDGADRVESFILTRVIPEAEGRHRRDACHRAIAGFSMGGYGAVNLAQRHPDVFGQAVSVAGYFGIDDPDHVFDEDPAARRDNSPNQQVARMHGLRLFLLDAGQENLKLVEGQADHLASLLVDARIPVSLNYSPGEHTSQYAFAQLPTVTGFLETGWTPRPF